MSLSASIASSILWLRRIRHRRGYGIHSPWVFELVAGVVYQSSSYAYYGYATLPAVAGWRQKDLRLLLRLSNHFQPAAIALCGVTEGVGAWLQAGCHRAQMHSEPAAIPHIVMRRADGAECIITRTCDDSLWRKITEAPCVALDLYHLGLVYRGLGVPAQMHVINYT